MSLFQGRTLAFLLSVVVLLVTVSSFLALYLSLHSAYLWLAVLFVGLIFLATFTCTYTLPGFPGYYAQHSASQGSANPSIDGRTNLSFQADTGTSYHGQTIDLPPAYDMVAEVFPPSYSKATSGMLKLDLSHILFHNSMAPIESQVQGSSNY